MTNQNWLKIPRLCANKKCWYSLAEFLSVKGNDNRFLLKFCKNSDRKFFAYCDQNSDKKAADCYYRNHFWCFTFYSPFKFIIFSFRIAIEKLAQGNYFKHPLYTFCPEFSDEIVPFVNITPKTSLKKVMLSSLDIVPSDFLISVTDG